MGRTRPELSAVIPLFNEHDGLDELYRRVSLACRNEGLADYEIVLVNDGSTDGTREKAFDLAHSDSRVTVIDLSRNYGHQVALTAGLEFCSGRRIFILDADLQDPPELLGPMMRKMDEGYDVVYGVRTSREGETWFKRASASLFYRFLRRLSDTDIAEDAGDFRLMSRRALDHLIEMPERFRFIRGMVSWLGFRQYPMPYDRSRRLTGVSKYPLKKMLLLAVDAVTSFSILPLRVASLAGLVVGVFGLLLLGYTLASWMLGHVVQGWTSIAAIVLILGSVQLFVLGVFGEYLGRMYIEVKRRPLYIVREIARGGRSVTEQSVLERERSHVRAG